jgi:hypothetical protein
MPKILLNVASRCQNADRSVHVEQAPLVNQSTMMAVAITEASAAADKLVATTRGRQTGIDNNQLRQWWACRGVGGAAAVKRPHGGIVGVRGDWWACCGVGRAAVGHQWR